MAKTTIILTPLLKVVAILLLTTGNSWASTKYAQKFGMACKNCHSSESELNELGLRFKKNGYTFGKKSPVQKDSLKQNIPQDDNSADSVSTGRSPNKTEPKTSISETVAIQPDSEQPLPETRVYSWKDDNGIMHYSDTPYNNLRGEKKTAQVKTGKNIVRAGFRPLSAIVPKRQQKAVSIAAAQNPVKTYLHKADSSGSFEKAQIEKNPAIQTESFEDCMAQLLISQSRPKTPEAAMEQFQEAETICEPYIKKPSLKAGFL